MLASSNWMCIQDEKRRGILKDGIYLHKYKTRLDWMEPKFSSISIISIKAALYNLLLVLVE